MMDLVVLLVAAGSLLFVALAASGDGVQQRHGVRPGMPTRRPCGPIPTPPLGPRLLRSDRKGDV